MHRRKLRSSASRPKRNNNHGCPTFSRNWCTRKRFALALQELGNAVPTTFLLDWIMDDTMRRAVHECTTNIERHHHFAKHLASGEHGLLRSNYPADQEKAVVYNELVANAVVVKISGLPGTSPEIPSPKSQPPTGHDSAAQPWRRHRVCYPGVLE